MNSIFLYNLFLSLHIISVIAWIPAMIFSWLFGLALISNLGVDALFQLWLQLKIIFVILMSGVHGYFSKLTREFQEDKRPKSERFFRIINEFPTVLMIIVVFLVIFKPI